MSATTKTSARTTIGAKSKHGPSGRESLRELINSTLARSREADPHVIARRLLPKLSAEVREELLLIGLVDRVSKAVQMARSGGVAPRREGPSKWAIGLRVCVAGEWKPLDDCDLSDLSALAEQHRAIAAQNLARAEEYDQLADELRGSGCRTVGELRARKDLAA